MHSAGHSFDETHHNQTHWETENNSARVKNDGEKSLISFISKIIKKKPMRVELYFYPLIKLSSPLLMENDDSRYLDCNDVQDSVVYNHFDVYNVYKTKWNK